ncbi:MAG: CrcB-like protein [Idiomarinaceae bacterium HL-53]|nr:MAG: CrcB-like protein [Idiomarinaceae bacterium HL-53]CUS49048.1 CrcB protein [Idiomarinaceae bacterium HL-53]
MTSFSLASIICLSVGGAVGVLCRYFLSTGVARLQAPFILTNLISNTLGAGLLGWALAQGVNTVQLDILFIVGFCGGLSTLSGIWADVYRLGSHQRIVPWCYVLGTFILALLSFFWAGK